MSSKRTGYQYNEDRILDEIEEYIDSTYQSHYVTGDNENPQQIFDVWDAMGIAEESCLSNVIKYAYRYGKKDGYNKKDLMKLIHYAILLMHFTQHRKEDSDGSSKRATK